MKKRKLSENEIVRLKTIYPFISNEALALDFEVNINHINYCASMYGLKKSPEYIASLRRKGANITNILRWNKV